ncbi:hypothetical protein CKM354_000185500 [Cercospora kikuchii]|uniref:Uncharacterized protein n=1 Tax=Cercospora kikuchii TaxID=84275 RepID=A0A9P3C8V5_9PEZI|nr:uncharacterized protein CKM354_000185500 [Cercospora kikuchii]GIZ38438.1 hypothetical protein CKM354_000185500 [Cercospora kikuchii]
MDSLAAQFGAQLNMLDVEHAARAQINMDDLASAFESYRVTADSPPMARNMGPNTKHHQLVVVFPCFDLMPQGADVALEVPCNAAQREPPKKGAFFEHNFPDVMVRLPTRADVAHAAIPTFERKNLLESMVERLTLAPGFSTLNVVSYFATDLQTTPMYRFQLKTRWVTSSPNPLFEEEVQSIEVSAAEWSEIRTQGAQVSWVKLLESHVNRATDFSYLRVLERVKKHDPEVAHFDTSGCDTLFDSAPLQSVNNVLRIRMSAKGVRRTMIDDEQDIFELPCGHQFMCNETHLMCAMSEEDCFAAKCPQCEQKILHSDTDMVRVAIVYDRRARDYYKREREWWKLATARFKQEVVLSPSSHATRFSIKCKDFRTAIVNARKSFRVPATAMPNEINFAGYPETIVICDRLVQNLSHDFQSMTVMGRSTMGLLINFATQVLKEYTGVQDAADIWTVMPPRYRGFVLAWFYRTLVLAYYMVKKSEQQLGQMAEDLFVEKPDDSIKLGYKLDSVVMGKRRKSMSLHGAFGDVSLEKTRIPYRPQPSDWQKQERVLM